MSKKFIDDIPPLFKGILSVTAAGAVLFGMFKLYSYIKEKQANAGNEEEINAATEEAKKLVLSGKQKPTLNEVQLKNMVNGIKVALLNYDALTRAHVQPIYKELVKLANDVDTLNLIRAYDIQTIDFPTLKFTAGDFTGGLTDTLKNFLNNTEVNAANGILARKSIKYRL